MKHSNMTKLVTNGIDISASDQEQVSLPAGDFSSWLRHARNALLDNSGTDVACGDCIGCCSSSYFIHIHPQEKATLKCIPRDVLFPAPGQLKRHKLMGYDEKGFCPMLKNGKCSIYDQRPLTCRNYDCRIFTATGIAAGGKDKSLINQRVGAWQFSYPTQMDRDEHLAVQAAAAFIRDHADYFPGGRVPANPSQLAILAIKAYEVLLNRKPSPAPEDNSADTDIANAIVEACREFDARMKTET